MHIDPDIFLFRHVLNEKEVQRIKELALPVVGYVKIHEIFLCRFALSVVLERISGKLKN